MFSFTKTAKPVQFLKISSCFAASFAMAALAVSATAGFAQSLPAIAQNRVFGPIDDSRVVTLAGNVHPMARPEFDRGVISGDTRLERMALVLAPSAAQQQALDAFSEAQQEPGSAHYHQWLTPEEFGKRFGVSAADAARVATWLAGHGFEAEPVTAGQRLILFSGSEAQVEETFHTQIHQYEVNGAVHIANSQDPQIPSALAPVVTGILSLHDFRRASASHALGQVAAAAVNPDNTQGGTHYLFPTDLATIYDLNALYTAGENGSGASIAIVGRSNINLSDVASFRSYSALPANQPTVILNGANPGVLSGGEQDEATLDAEWSGATAPAAKVNFVVSASTATTDGVDLSAEYIVNNKTANVMSTSFGSCELYMGTAENAFYNALWQQAATEGISAFVSSGDSGAAGCDGGSSTTGTRAGVNGLCSSPYSTCVGGTEFNETNGNYWASTNGAGGGSALGYIPEKVWNESASDSGSGLWSSGGGVSTVYPQPSWQKGVSGANGNGMRTVPDVALTAAGHDGYLICENGSWYVIGGTSAASPSFAGIMSIVDQKQANVGQGNANPLLYGLLSGYANSFHPTPSGNNSVPGVAGFTASGASYNLATGLGSVDANLLVKNWPSTSKAPAAGFSVAASVASASVTVGKSATFTVSVKAIGSFSSSVALTASVPSGVSVSFSPASIKPGAASTATITVASSAAAGASTITVTGTSAGVSETARLALTVVAPKPTLAMTAAASSINLTRGKTATLQVAIATGGSFTGAVTMSVTGLTSGVTASWSKSSFSVSGAASTVSTLTLTASSSATPTSGTLNIIASGDGMQSVVQCAVKVTTTPAAERPIRLHSRLSEGR